MDRYSTHAFGHCNIDANLYLQYVNTGFRETRVRLPDGLSCQV